jgi:hypothetical protein
VQIAEYPGTAFYKTFASLAAFFTHTTSITLLLRHPGLDPGSS